MDDKDIKMIELEKKLSKKEIKLLLIYMFNKNKDYIGSDRVSK